MQKSIKAFTYFNYIEFLKENDESGKVFNHFCRFIIQSLDNISKMKIITIKFSN